MTDETKKLFDAPWKAVEMENTNFPYLHECEIVTNDGKGHMIATEALHSDANRIARLPELYCALLQATEDACWTCNHEKAEGILDRPCNDLHSNECYVAQWRELLRKVRDGK